MDRARLLIGSRADREEPLVLDLHTLLETRLLIAGASGSGKTHLMKRIMEEADLTRGLQQVIHDVEGEFSRLPEICSSFIVHALDANSLAPESETNPEFRANFDRHYDHLDAIYLYEEAPSEIREQWLDRYIKALILAPDTLWGPCLQWLDEAHLFAPERGTGDSLALQSVVDLVTRGRKRGICTIAATQDVSQLSKRVAGQLNNKMVGRVTDVSQAKRACAELGWGASKDDLARLGTEEISRGEFHCRGPAFVGVDSVCKVMVGSVDTPKRPTGGWKR